MATSIDPMALSTTATSYLLSTYYDKRLLERLVPRPVMWDHGQKRSLPKGEGKSVKWSRFVNLGVGSRLSEGTRSTPKVISSLNVTATLTQIGDYAAVSDFVDMTAISSIVEGAIDLFATQAATAVDLIARDALFGEATNSIEYPNRNLSVIISVTTVSAIAGKTKGFYIDVPNQLSSAPTKKLSGCVTLQASAWNKYHLTVQDIREGVQRLKENDVPTFDDGYYIGFIHPTATAGLKKDAEWKNWNQYSGELAKATMYKGEVGEIERVRFVESTLVFKKPLCKGSNISACFTTIVGKDAYGVVDYDGGVHVYVKNPNQYDTSNPLNQWTTIGWKATLAARILDSARGLHIMSING